MQNNNTFSVFSGLVVFAISSLAYAAGLGLPAPVKETDFLVHSQEKVELGKVLFYDKILSGNRNISCATCHHSLLATGDGLSLPVGEGGSGLAMTRNTGVDSDAIEERVPRNAPAVFNLGAFEFIRMFHDGRLEVDPGEISGYFNPAGDFLPQGLESVLAAQALFPVTSTAEMAGQAHENEIGAAATAGDFPLVWGLIVARLRAIDTYVELFRKAYPNQVSDAADISIVQVGNAIGAYEDMNFRATNSPFDRYLRGDRRALSFSALAGMRLFYGKAGCSECHSGTFLTDHEFHAVGMPQIGPGKGDSSPGGDVNGDFGRERVTGNLNDRYKFRTPSLRNVALTGPWGHDGAYTQLEAAVKHMLDPETAVMDYDDSQALLPSRDDLDAEDLICLADPLNRAEMIEAIEIEPVKLSAREFGSLMDFLYALTDPASLNLSHTVPSQVPSGLPVAD